MKKKVLLVDDEKSALDALKRQLCDRFEIDIVTDPITALELIRNNRPYGVIVSDYRMPKLDGVEFLKAVKSISPDSGRVILTGYGDLQSIIRAINESSVHRYLEKPVTSSRLLCCIDRAMDQYDSKVTLRRSLESLSAEINKGRAQRKMLSKVDQLSGLTNRRATAQLIDEWHEALISSANEELLIIIDVIKAESFYGTLAIKDGEEMIRTLEAKLRGFIGDKNVAGRWYGNSLILTLPLCGMQKELHRIMHELTNVIFSSKTSKVSRQLSSISIGAVIAREIDKDLHKLIRRVEKALGRSKVLGSNKYVIDDYRSNEQIIGSCPRDILEKKFILLPRKDIDTGKTIAATATLMYSNKFIERREDDLYRDVFNPGYSVVYRDIQNIIEVCKLQAQWILEGRNIPISIGVSASLIGFDGGVKKIKNILKEYKVKERYLEFEISYADLPVNLKQAEINIMAFRDLGVEMTLAEIGRERVTSNELINIGCDKLKLHKTIAQEVEYDVKVQDFVRRLVSWAHGQEIKVICTGVDKKKQLSVFRDLDCDFAEGMFISESL